jgi:hypothetical protein
MGHSFQLLAPPKQQTILSQQQAIRVRGFPLLRLKSAARMEHSACNFQLPAYGSRPAGVEEIS